ncbi:hypothetical protein B0T22DRAFT_523271 [Podospora appendiculata]|uniref:FAD-binding domain-containing protein n=1 Tax=Podospora appendiculata TaxID=314037 RepID=A0AAE0WYW2_9PEZI|nr:hypothetical protein B0T22DRAFT_523271 [Podospora appendiculata]
MVSEKHSPPSTLRLAIIGAGPAGTCLARLLITSPTRLVPAQSKIEIAIFERETGLSSRDQGGTLDLHKATGLAALKAAGLYDEFLTIARWDGDALTVADKHMTRYLSLRSSAANGKLALGKPEVDRRALRKLLLDSLPPGIVRWGRRVAKVDAVKRMLLFEDGTEEGPWDLIVGADGTNSIIRPLLTPEEPFYSGVAGFNMVIPAAAVTRPLLSKLVAGGSVFAFGDGKVVMGQQLGDGGVYVSVWAVKPENWVLRAGYNIHDGAAVKAALLDEYREWAPEVRELLSAFDESVIWPRSLMMLPVGIRWDNKPGLTLLGDAAHVMTPFVGEGVNGAMADALELSRAILEAVDEGWEGEVLKRQVKNYEDGMFRRVRVVQKMTEDMMKLMLFTEGAPRSVMAQWIVRSMSDDLGPFKLAGFRIAASAYYFFFKLAHRK